MNAASLNENRCQFLFADGRRCRSRRTPHSDSLCYPHWRREQDQVAALRIGDEIVGAAGALNTQEGIHQALSNVFANLARGRISPRSAAVLGYVGQLMLVSRPSLERTIQSLLPALQLAIKVGHQNTQSQIKSDVALRKNALLEMEIIKGFMAQFEAFRAMSPEDLLRMLKLASIYADKPQATPAAQAQQTPTTTPQGTPDAKTSPATQTADSKINPSISQDDSK